MNPHGQLIFCSASSEHRSALVRQNITCPSGLTHFLEYTRYGGKEIIEGQ